MISVPRSRERSMASQIRRVLPSRSPTVVLIWAMHTRSMRVPRRDYTAVGPSGGRAVGTRGKRRKRADQSGRDSATTRPRLKQRQRVRFAELGRVAVDRAAPEALRSERYLTPTSNSRFPLANTFLPCNGERGQFGTFVPLLWTMGIRRTTAGVGIRD